MAGIQITFPDGSRREFSTGTTALDVAKSIGPRLASDALAAKFGDQCAQSQEITRRMGGSLQ